MWETFDSSQFHGVCHGRKSETGHGWRAVESRRTSSCSGGAVLCYLLFYVSFKASGRNHHMDHLCRLAVQLVI